MPVALSTAPLRNPSPRPSGPFRPLASQCAPYSTYSPAREVPGRRAMTLWLTTSVARTSPLALRVAPCSGECTEGRLARLALERLELEAHAREQVRGDVAPQPAAQLHRRRLQRRQHEARQRVAARDLQERVARRRILVDDECAECAGPRRRFELAAHASRDHHAPALEAEVRARFEVRVVGQHDHDAAAHVDAGVRVPAARRIDDTVAAEHQRRVRDLGASGVAQRQRRLLADRERHRLAADRHRQAPRRAVGPAAPAAPSGPSCRPRRPARAPRRQRRGSGTRRSSARRPRRARDLRSRRRRAPARPRGCGRRK